MSTPDSGMTTTSCATDGDCDKRCHPDTKTCVACRFDVDCGAGQWCRGSQCVASEYCANNDHCDGAQVCDMARKHCSVCVADEDCPTNSRCVDAERCEPYKSCVNSLNCELGQVCDLARGQCVECTMAADCGDGKVCVRNECKASCASDNDCTSKGLLCRTEASPAAQFCAQCTKDADCSADRHCADGVCKADVCVAGEKRCDEARVCGLSVCEDLSNPACCYIWTTFKGPLVCKANGSGFETPSKSPTAGSCGGQQTCVDGQGVAVCEDRVCTAATTHCDTERSAIIECSEDGLTILHSTPCGDGKICDAATCIPVICTPGARRCHQGHPELCNTLGTAWTQQDTCEANEYCSEDGKVCLLSSSQTTVGSNLYTGAVAMADSVANRITMTETRKLSGFAFYYTSSATLTFFVYVETTTNNFARIAQVVTTNVEACSSSYCGVTFDALTLEAGKRYLLGMHSTANTGNHYYSGQYAYPFPGGSTSGSYHAISASAPEDPLVFPGSETSTYYMRITTAKPD